MVPSKTSHRILSKSGVFTSLCAMDYHNVSCQNARAAITQRCIVIDQILGWGLKVTWALELKQTDNRLWKDDREHFQDTESTEGQAESQRGRSWGAWSKEPGKRKQGAALVSKAKPGSGRRGKRKGRGEGKGRVRRQELERAKVWPRGLASPQRTQHTAFRDTESNQTLALRVRSGPETCPRFHCWEETELGQICQDPCPFFPSWVTMLLRAVARTGTKAWVTVTSKSAQGPRRGEGSRSGWGGGGWSLLNGLLS